MIGYNFNCLGGSAEIPTRYILHPSLDLEHVKRALRFVGKNIKPSRVRTLLWMAERDNVETPWLHIPLDYAEIIRIQEYAWVCNDNGIPLEISIAPLWEARWLYDGLFSILADPKPDNPFKTVDELFVAMQSSLWQLLFTERGLPPGTVLDIFNEFTLEDTQEPVMQLFYPWARDAIKRAGLISTASTIIDTDGTGKRAIATYKWLAELGYGMPDHLEVHVNSVPDEALRLNAASWKAQLMDAYGLDIVIGEDDQPRNDPRACAEWIQIVAPKEVIRWID